MKDKKKFNVWMHLFVQGSAFLIQMFGRWYAQNYTPESWATLEPILNDLMVPIHGLILAWSGGRIFVSNQIKKAEAKKEA